MKRSLFLTIAIVSFLGLGSEFGSFIQAAHAGGQKPVTQDQKDEQELQDLYGIDVERNRLGRASSDLTTRDRYGNGVVSVFQDNTRTARNLKTYDSIGVELKIFEFGK